MSSYIHHIKEFIEKSPLSQYTNIHITKIEAGIFECEVELLPFFKRHDGIAHGGFLSYLADTAMGFASLTTVPEDKTVFTAELKISFLDPGMGDNIKALAKVIRTGKTLHFCEAELYATKPSGEEYLCAKSSGTMVVANKRT